MLIRYKIYMRIYVGNDPKIVRFKFAAVLFLMGDSDRFFINLYV